MPTMGGNMYKYFDSEKFSDVTIKVNGEDIRAHKLVLAEGSEYFKACFDGGFKEATGHTMWLYGDDTHAMKRLIKHLYGWNYGTFTDDILQNAATHGSGITSFVSLYVVGQKYLVPTVCAEATASFIALLDRMSGTDEHGTIFRATVEHVYVTYALEAAAFRELLVAHFVKHVRSAVDKQAFRELFKDVPDFAFDVVEAVVRQPAESGATKAAPGRKRRRY